MVKTNSPNGIVLFGDQDVLGVQSDSEMTEEYLEERARRGNREKYEAALAQVPDVEPEPYDRKNTESDG